MPNFGPGTSLRESGFALALRARGPGFLHLRNAEHVALPREGALRLQIRIYRGTFLGQRQPGNEKKWFFFVSFF